jgi:thiamine biosynthesis lipoprotein
MRSFRIFTAAVCLILLTACSKTAVSEPFFALDTAVSVSVSGKSADETLTALTEMINSESAKLEKCYDLPADEVLPDVLELITKTEALNSEYGYAVNIFCGELTELWGISTDTPRVPTETEIENAIARIPTDKSGIIAGVTKIDPGAVLKGYALDLAKAAIETAGETQYAVISTESSVLLYGNKPNGELFVTGIKNPDGGLVGCVKTGAAFLSTAGGTERYFEADGNKYIHILDLSTGYPTQSDLDSVTVIIPADEADGGIKSDFLSTAMFLTGIENLDSYGVTYVAVGADGAVYTNTEVFPV